MQAGHISDAIWDISVYDSKNDCVNRTLAFPKF